MMPTRRGTRLTGWWAGHVVGCAESAGFPEGPAGLRRRGVSGVEYEATSGLMGMNRMMGRWVERFWQILGLGTHSV
jgi:hypothetical protein